MTYDVIHSSLFLFEKLGLLYPSSACNKNCNKIVIKLGLLYLVCVTTEQSFINCS